MRLPWASRTAVESLASRLESLLRHEETRAAQVEALVADLNRALATVFFDVEVSIP